MTIYRGFGSTEQLMAETLRDQKQGLSKVTKTQCPPIFNLGLSMFCNLDSFREREALIETIQSASQLNRLIRKLS